MNAPQKSGAPVMGGAADQTRNATGSQQAALHGQHTIVFSYGHGHRDNTPTTCQAPDGPAFLDWLAAHRDGGQKVDWFAGPFAAAPDDAAHQATPAKRAAIGKSHRCRACALPRRFVCLDLDEGLSPAGFEALKLICASWQGCVYTTASHRPERPRCRVVLMLDAPVAPGDLARVTQAAQRRIDAGQAAYLALQGHTDAPPALLWDQSCNAPAQPLFLAPPDAEFTRLSGAPLVLAELVAEMPAAPPAPTAPPAPVEVDATLLADLTDALDHIPADEYRTWVRMGCALHKLGEAGHDLWLTWSGKSPKHDAEADPAVWDTFGSRQTGPGAVFAEAARCGWQNPAAARRAASVFGARAVSRAHNPNSHLANAERIADHFGDCMLYVEGIGWHVRDPAGPWFPDDAAALAKSYALGRIVAAEAAAILRGERQEAPGLGTDSLREVADARLKWAGKCEQVQSIDPSLRLARPLLHARAGDMDGDPLLLGVPNGILDLQSLTLRPYSADDRVTRVMGAPYDPTATAPAWEQFIEDTLQGDAELVDWVQRLFGYALSGSREEHVLPILWGSGGNGKSTFNETLRYVFGGYGAVGARDLIMSEDARHASSVADLCGRRLVIVSETKERGRLNEESVKGLTGGDRIKARRMYQEPFEFRPSHLLVLHTNHKPQVAGTDDGIWRRIRLIPFTRKLEPHEMDASLKSRLQAQAPGILNWLLEGWRQYQRRGLNDQPPAVRQASAGYRSDNDALQQWLDDCTERDATATTSAGDLYASYSAWARRGGEVVVSQRMLASALTERGYRQSRTHTGRQWRGLRLVSGTGRRSVPPPPGEVFGAS